MIPLKHATASQEIPLGPFVDDSDGVTAETGLTIANTDIKLWKSGATTLASKNSGGSSHISGGIYVATLDDTDTDTYGPLTIFVQVSGALAVKLDCWVLEADAYDALFAASGTGHIDTDVQATADQVWDELKAGHTGAGTFGEEVQDHALFSEIPTVGEIADQVWQEALADHSGTSGSTAEALNNAGGGLTSAGIAGAVWEEQLSDHSGTAGSAAEYLEGAGGGATPSAIAGAVWDETLSGHTSAGTAGKALQDIPGAQAGAIEYTYTVDDGTNPIEGAEVWIATDSGGSNIIWYGLTDASGTARASNDEKPWLDPGTYYVWVKKSGHSFSNPDTIDVS